MSMAETKDLATVDPAASRQVKPLGAQLIDKKSNFAAALPAHIPVERFMRIVLTATQNDPELIKADRASLWTACMKAAQDGLLPDGRDGALVIYNTKVKDPVSNQWVWVKKVQWMPMVGGIRKKVRNSSTIATWDVQAVYAKDSFDFELGDDPFIKHKPYLPGPLGMNVGEKPEAYAARLKAHMDRGPLMAVYSVAVLKTGEKSRDVMSVGDVEAVRDNYSRKNSDGGFSPAWVKSFAEMAKKTVARRHSKVLPMSSDLDDLLRRDDALYDLDGASDRTQTPRLKGPKATGDRIDALMGLSPPAEDETPASEGEEGLSDGEVVDNETGEILSQSEAAENSAAKPSVEAPGSTAAALTNTGPQEGAGSNVEPGPALSEKDKAILADLMATGAARASSGDKALRHFLDNLEPGERKMLPPASVAEWVKIARAVKPAAA